ncbi:beta strand repeat-containing protein [Candidatus Magnetominusculus dajiuhuensis]|uniref:beta strand repeat-containing protein n=1 Tax=Candidatus Magnetominusculus dajiuhuensis TaxID=3137712 RepID=UPI003B4284F2
MIHAKRESKKMLSRLQHGFSNYFKKYIIGIFSCLIALFSYSTSDSAIITDGTVGWGGTLVGPKFIIPASIGTTVGNNLFQSFSTFNIMTGESATFTGSSNIQNVIARVTGGLSSSIDGTLSCSISGANLYLINPAGVIFGKNATLDIKGSFYVSTADYLKLSDGGRYDAKTPSNSILTSAPPSAFGFLTSNPAGVTVTGALLQVPTGKTISIVAGDINITNGYLYAPGGQINLASVASTGEALMSSSGTNVDGFAALGTINITQTDSTRKTINGITIGNLDVSNQTGGSGSIYIRGGKFVIDNGQIVADTYGDTNGGGINVNITGDMSITNGGQIEAGTAGKGNAGSINIQTSNLNLTSAGQIVNLSSSGSTGNVGNITIKASDTINIDGESGIYSQTSGQGNAGSISIETNNLSLTNSGEISTSSISGGTGKAGDITIKASDTIKLDGESGIYSQTYGKGNAGAINIDTKDLTIAGASEINTSARSGSSGNAGNITIIASDTINISGYYDAGDDVVYSSVIRSETYGKGNAGSIDVQTKNLSITNTALISTSALPGSSGNAGDITIKASGSINISGYYDTGNDGIYSSGVYSETYGKGNAGSISVETNNLNITDLGTITTTAMPGSTGSGGNINIKASDFINIAGHYAVSGGVYSTGIYSETFGQGNAGSIDIQTKNLTLTDVGTITTTSLSGSTGKSGNITIKASDSINITGYYDAGDGAYVSGIYSETLGKGDAGSINIETSNLNISDAGRISTTAMSGSTGSGGNINIKASDFINITGYYAGSDGFYSSGIYSETDGIGNAGSINVETSNLNIANTGLITTTARPGSTGSGGNINIKASDTVNISGYYVGSDSFYSSGIYSETSGKGSAGGINIETNNLSLTNAGTISTSADSGSTGNAGNITINASDSIYISNYFGTGKNVYSNGILSDTYGSGKAGDITILTNNLTLVNAGKISTSAESGSTGSGGNISVLALGSINISGFYTNGYDVYQSGIYSETNSSGNAGDVTLLSRNLYIDDNGLITARSTGTGNAGNITVKTAETLQMNNGGDIATSSKYTTGGNIDIAAADIRLYNDSGITSNVSKGKDKGGNITVTAGTLCLLDSSAISADADTGYGGDITINAGTVFLWSQEKALHASSTISGQSGTITINSPLTDISGSMVALTPRYLEAEKLLPESCEARRKSKGSFVIRGLGNLTPWNSKFSF